MPEREPCDRCGAYTENRAPANDVLPLCRACQEELEFWVDLFSGGEA